jgi:hypothetical protein
MIFGHYPLFGLAPFPKKWHKNFIKKVILSVGDDERTQVIRQSDGFLRLEGFYDTVKVVIISTADYREVVSAFVVSPDTGLPASRPLVGDLLALLPKTIKNAAYYREAILAGDFAVALHELFYALKEEDILLNKEQFKQLYLYAHHFRLPIQVQTWDLFFIVEKGEAVSAWSLFTIGDRITFYQIIFDYQQQILLREPNYYLSVRCKLAAVFKILQPKGDEQELDLLEIYKMLWQEPLDTVITHIRLFTKRYNVMLNPGTEGWFNYLEKIFSLKPVA